ncbi:MAG: hypothetical protein ACRCWR_02340 [Saezia sp.]
MMSDVNHQLTIDHRTHTMHSCLVSTLDYYSKSATASSDTGYQFYSIIMTFPDRDQLTLTFQRTSSIEDQIFSKTLDIIGQSDIVIDTKTKTFSAAIPGIPTLHMIPYLDLE